VDRVEEVAAPAGEQTISVVIPVKDDARHLERCLRDLARQHRPADEVIVVDNGSSDDSAEVARRHGATVVPEPEPGIPAAAATGYDAARGTLIARCDADSRLPPDWLARIAQELQDADAVTGAGRFYGLRGRAAPLGGLLSGLYLGAYSLAAGAALGHAPLFGSNLGLRRSAWRDVRDEVHRSDRDLHDDLDLSFHLGERHRIRRVRGLVVGISSRPFADRAALRLRFRRGMRTVTVHWPEQFPPYRWTRRARLRATAGRTSGPRLRAAGRE
jgi:glycosyltransferase involved in cell wall biosynthesis